jgi:hypothetical protein
MVDFIQGQGPLSNMGLQEDEAPRVQAPTGTAPAPADEYAETLRQARKNLYASRATGMDPLTTFLLAASQGGPGGIGASISRGGIAAQQAMGEQAKSNQAFALKDLDLALEEDKYKRTLIQQKDEKDAERKFRAEEAVKSDERDFKNQTALANMLSESRLEVAKITAAPRLEAAANKKPATIEAQDKIYGADLAKWNINGKGVAAEQLSKLDEVTTLLEQNTDVSGKFVGLLPRYVRSQASKNAEDLIGSIVQSDLRQILGGQFAQREGENLLKRAYAIDVGETDNLERVKRLKTRILSAIEAKNEMADYFDERGTMQGYKGKTVDDIYQEMKKELETVKEPVATPGADSPTQVPDTGLTTEGQAAFDKHLKPNN